MENIEDKLAAWLAKQGYPLEFATAHEFAKYGFNVFRGVHRRDQRENKLREIDVVAMKETTADGRTFRISFVCECKWSRDKPWVIFAGPTTRADKDERIAYAVASRLGEVFLWHLVEDRAAQDLTIFPQHERFGFGGRQAFSDADLFYAAVQGITPAAVAQATSEDGDWNVINDTMKIVHIVFPIVVVDGSLYEASFEQHQLSPKAVNSAAVKWRGSDARRVPAFITLVAASHLCDYVAAMAPEVDKLLALLVRSASAATKPLLSRRWTDATVQPLRHPTLVVPSLLESIAGRIA